MADRDSISVIMFRRMSLVLLIIFVTLPQLPAVKDDGNSCIYCNKTLDNECTLKVRCHETFGDSCYFYREGAYVWKGCGGCDRLGKKGTQCCRGKLCNLFVRDTFDESNEPPPGDKETFDYSDEASPRNEEVEESGHSSHRKRRMAEDVTVASDTSTSVKEKSEDGNEFSNYCMHCHNKLSSECTQKLHCYKHFGDSCYTHKDGDRIWKGCGCHSFKADPGSQSKCCTGNFCNKNEISDSLSNTAPDQDFGNYCMYCNKKYDSQCNMRLHCFQHFGDSCYAYREGIYVWKGCGCSMMGKKGTKCCKGKYCNQYLSVQPASPSFQSPSFQSPGFQSSSFQSPGYPHEQSSGFENTPCYVCGKTEQFQCKTTMNCHLRFGQYCYTYKKDKEYWYGCGCPTYTKTSAFQRCCSGRHCNYPRADIFDIPSQKTLYEIRGPPLSEDLSNTVFYGNKAHRDVSETVLPGPDGNFCFACEKEPEENCWIKQACSSISANMCWTLNDGFYVWKGCGCNQALRGVRCCIGSFCNSFQVDSPIIVEPPRIVIRSVDSETDASNHPIKEKTNILDTWKGTDYAPHKDKKEQSKVGSCRYCLQVKENECTVELQCLTSDGDSCFIIRQGDAVTKGCGCNKNQTGIECCHGKFCNAISLLDDSHLLDLYAVTTASPLVENLNRLTNHDSDHNLQQDNLQPKAQNDTKTDIPKSTTKSQKMELQMLLENNSNTDSPQSTIKSQNLKLQMLLEKDSTTDSPQSTFKSQKLELQMPLEKDSMTDSPQSTFKSQKLGLQMPLEKDSMTDGPQSTFKSQKLELQMPLENEGVQDQLLWNSGSSIDTKINQNTLNLPKIIEAKSWKSSKLRRDNVDEDMPQPGDLPESESAMEVPPSGLDDFGHPSVVDDLSNPYLPSQRLTGEQSVMGGAAGNKMSLSSEGSTNVGVGQYLSPAHGLTQREASYNEENSNAGIREPVMQKMTNLNSGGYPAPNIREYRNANYGENRAPAMRKLSNANSGEDLAAPADMNGDMGDGVSDQQLPDQHWIQPMRRNVPHGDSVLSDPSRQQMQQNSMNSVQNNLRIPKSDDLSEILASQKSPGADYEKFLRERLGQVGLAPLQPPASRTARGENGSPLIPEKDGNHCYYCEKKLEKDCNETHQCHWSKGNRCFTNSDGGNVWKGCGCGVSGFTNEKCCTGQLCNTRNMAVEASAFSNFCMFCSEATESECTTKLHCYKRFGGSCYVYKENNSLWKGCGCNTNLTRKAGTRCCLGEYCNRNIKVMRFAPAVELDNDEKNIGNVRNAVSAVPLGEEDNKCYVCAKTGQFECRVTMNCHSNFDRHCYTYKLGTIFWYGCGCPINTKVSLMLKCCSGNFCNHPHIEAFPEETKVGFGINPNPQNKAAPEADLNEAEENESDETGRIPPGKRRTVPLLFIILLGLFVAFFLSFSLLLRFGNG